MMQIKLKSGLIYLLVILLLQIFYFTSCQKVDIEKEIKTMMDADRAFSNLSENQGRNEAFFTYCADNGVILRPDSYPVEGRETIKELLLQAPDDNYTLTWEPLYGFVSKSGDLGYTYGIWTLKTKDEEGEMNIQKGTYVSIWGKDEEGNWKYLLDTGNEGVGEEENT